jgi:hypothetical protein
MNCAALMSRSAAAVAWYLVFKTLRAELRSSSVLGNWRDGIILLSWFGGLKTDTIRQPLFKMPLKISGMGSTVRGHSHAGGSWNSSHN